jgi:penicillin-insensitive murein endopeptidase
MRLSPCFLPSTILKWVILCTIPTSLGYAKLVSPWTQVKTPTHEPAESIGTASAGCLKGGMPLSQDGKAYVLMRPVRGRFFGHARLVDLIQTVGHQNYKVSRYPLLIGDLSLPRGGPTLSAHSSHQTGLDVDIWYQQAKWSKRYASPRMRESLSALGMVDHKKTKVNRNFGKNQISLLRQFAEKENVDRILVHYAIKKELCDRLPNESWIHKIRPWFGHDHHFHVRIKCSDQDKGCKNGDPIPPGNGCDSTLAWWWSDEARAAGTKNTDRQENPVMPTLPDACSTVLSTSTSKSL